jgi:hypothetical protein
MNNLILSYFTGAVVLIAPNSVADAGGGVCTISPDTVRIGTLVPVSHGTWFSDSMSGLKQNRYSTGALLRLGERQSLFCQFPAAGLLQLNDIVACMSHL